MIQNQDRPLSYDRVIIGAGIFGLYAAWCAGKKGERVLVLEKAKEAFSKASVINQARIHRGYHYPRSFSTALATAAYVERFLKEFDFAINRQFEQIYAISRQFSYTGKSEYERFCAAAGIRCEEIDIQRYFDPTFIEAAYSTDEYSVDMIKVREYLLQKLAEFPNVDIWYSASTTTVEKDAEHYRLFVTRATGEMSLIQTAKVMNITYANLNQIIDQFAYQPQALKYEYAEMALCRVSQELLQVGITVMDGPFFSLMPFGSSGLHSLSAVSYTPHKVRYSGIEEIVAPPTRFPEMRQLAKKFLRPEFDMQYERSMFTTKTTLQKTELDDARPTCIIEHSTAPYFVSILSGKLNTIFDLEDII